MAPHMGATGLKAQRVFRFDPRIHASQHRQLLARLSIHVVRAKETQP